MNETIVSKTSEYFKKKGIILPKISELTNPHSINENVVKIATECDYLIHDSHFTKSDLPNHLGWGHSSWANAVDVAKIANVNKLVLFHYSPEYDDDTIDSDDLMGSVSFSPESYASLTPANIGLVSGDISAVLQITWLY